MLSELFQLSYAKRHPEWGVFLFRLFLGAVLVYGTQDNVFSSVRMLEFRDFLAQNGFPYSLLCAYASAYAQLTAGILFLLGVFTRYAALVMIVNFIVALAMVHTELPFSANIAPLAMLFGSVLFFFQGAGPYSIDAWQQERVPSLPMAAIRTSACPSV